MKIELIKNTPYEKKGLVKNVSKEVGYSLIKRGFAKEVSTQSKKKVTDSKATKSRTKKQQ